MKIKQQTVKIEPAANNHEFVLVARAQFRDYKRGDRISQASEVDKILACHENSMVIKVKNNEEGR